MLALTFKLRTSSNDAGLLYSLALVTMIVCGYRVYLLLLKSHMFDDTVYRVSILFDFGIIHLLFFFLVSIVSSSEEYYMLFVVAFMPVTCLCGIFLKERCKRVWLSQLMNDSMNSEGE